MVSDILIIIALIGANALFTISDMAVIAAKKNRLQMLADEGKVNAIKALKLAEDPTRIIATTQIGLTVITLLEGAFIEASLSSKVAHYLQNLAYFQGYESQLASVLVFLIVTLVLILFGDILPKRIAILYPETVVIFLAPIATKIIKLLWPIVNCFVFLSNSLLRMFGLNTKPNEEVSADDITTMIAAGAQSGVLVKTEQDLFENVWRLDESKVGSLMSPRSDIVYIDVNASVNENIEKILANPSQNLLVCRGDLDHVLGYIPAIKVIKKLFINTDIIAHSINWNEGLKQVHLIPNSLTLIEILESFRTHKTHLALVYNEFGHVEGLITLGDLVTAVIGDIPSVNAPTNLLIEKDPSGKWLVDGLASINDLLNELEITELPEGDNGNYQTAAGFVISIIGRQHGRLPKVFDKFEFADYIFEVVDINRESGYRVDKIMVRCKEQQNAN
jgi:putative hemolysin